MNRAYLEAIKIAVADCGRAGADLRALVPEADPVLAREQCEAAVPLIKNEVSDKIGIGQLDPTMIADDWKWVAKAQGYKPDRLDPETIVDRRFIPKSGS